MLNLRKLEGITLYFSIFLISIQLGKHFWPDFAFVQGIRVDYLSPTLYLSDIFVLLFIVLHIFNNFRKFLKLISKSFILPLFLVSILVSSIFAQNFDASIYWSLKIIEMIIFAFCIANFSFSKTRLLKLIDILVVSASLQSIIAIFQFALQKSLNGPFYFLGERSFNIDTIGIATFFTSGMQVLRPYGTFPHPNVLALFLAIALVFLIHVFIKEKTGKRVYVYIVLSLPIVLALLMTASRIIIFLTLLVSLFAFIKSRKHLIYAILIMLLVIPVYLIIFSGRFFTLEPIFESISVRLNFMRLSLEIFLRNALFGVGLNNAFFETQKDFELPIFARFQPVHNIYLLVLSQIGIFGGLVVGAFLTKVWQKIVRFLRIKGSFSFIVSLIMIEIIVIGLFDHFLITLQQGMLVVALITGLIFNNTTEQELG